MELMLFKSDLGNRGISAMWYNTHQFIFGPYPNTLNRNKVCFIIIIGEQILMLKLIQFDCYAQWYITLICIVIC